MSDLVPVAIFCYNRARHLRAMLESYDACPGRERTRPFVFCDGAKDESSASAVTEVRRVVQEWAIKANVEVKMASGNQGLSNSIVSGVSEILERHDRVIVLEDDLILDSRFLSFHLEGLERFAKAENVYQISGFQWSNLPGGRSAFFTPLSTTWGWSTWKRAWQNLDLRATGSERLQHDGVLRRRFDLEDRYPFAELLRHRLEGKNDSWGILWYWTIFSRHGLVLYPPGSVVSNAGFDGSGTHCEDDGAGRGVKSGYAGPIRMPRGVKRSRLRYLWMKRALYRQCRSASG